MNFQILHKTFDTLRFAQNLDFKTGSARILIREWVSKLALNVSGNIWNLHHNVYRRIFLNLHLFYFENNYFLKLKVNTWLKVYKISSFTNNLNFSLFVKPVTKKQYVFIWVITKWQSYFLLIYTSFWKQLLFKTKSKYVTKSLLVLVMCRTHYPGPAG